MNKSIEKKFQNISQYSTRVNKTIATFFLENNPKINKIQDMANKINISLSTAHRFIKAMGYPTFTHFIYAYNDIDENRVDNKSPNIEEIIRDKAYDFSKKLKSKPLYIITSVRAKSIGKYMSERLNDGRIPNTYFSHTTMKIEDFIKSTKNSAVIIFDISGHSYFINNVTKHISEISYDERPGVFYISASSKALPDEYNFFVPFVTLTKKENASDWHNYNESMKIIFSFVTKILCYLK